jgi:hypothetical protein
VRRFLLLFLVFLPSLAPADAPTELTALLTTYNQHARFPLPDLLGRDFGRLTDGKLLKMKDVPENPDLPIRVIGMVVSSEPRDELWLANRDPHYSVTDGVTEVLLTERGVWPQVWYQHIDAPRPFTDRHWTINVGDTWELANATGGRCWEHWWTLSDDGLATATKAVSEGRVPGLTAEGIEDAIYTPANQGAWLVCSLSDGRTLLGYHTAFLAGGSIPEWFITDWGMATLGKMIKGVEDNSRDVHDHYRTPHYLIHGGHGSELPLY